MIHPGRELRVDAVSAEPPTHLPLDDRPTSDDLTALTELGATLCRLRRIGQAEEVLVRALQIAPACPTKVLSKLATIRLIQGRSDEAVALVRTALESDPTDSALHSKLIGIMAYTEAADTSSIKTEQRAWDRAHARAGPSVAARASRQTRKLRVGYLANDLRDGPAARAFTAIPRHANRDDFETFCYSGAPAWDQASIDLCFHVDAWRTTQRLDDAALDAQIRRDRIDILVDLCGHMDRNRLPVVARRPAPVQLSGWGYTPGPGITGVDGLMTDQVVVPSSERSLFPERLLDLPCAQYYQHPRAAPDPGPLPGQVNGFLTLGCLNRVEKIGPAVCTAWADILRDLDRARLVLMDSSFADPAMPAALLDRFNRLGIAPHRVAFLPRRPFDDYLVAYQGMDLALDPWPHSGGLTTFDALWMGVPVVTLRGRHPLGRTSASILHCLGLSELVAADVGSYVGCVLALARSAERLAELRTSLRGRIERSSMGNPASYTCAVEDVYREAWNRWGGAA
jgi:protein O-GlcNAc transferase